MASNSEYSSQKNYSWAVFLILIGVLFLLNTTGVVAWGIWLYILRFWPILIVLIGVRIILGNSLVARIVGMLITVLLTIATFFVSYIQFTGKELSFLPKKVNDWVLDGGSEMFNISGELLEESNTYSFKEYEDIEERKLTMDIMSGKLTISEGNIEEHLKIDTSYPKSFKPTDFENTFKDGFLDLQFTGASPNSIYYFNDESNYEILLGELDILTSFDIKLGAGRGDISFEKLKVKDLWAEVGAGELDIDLEKDSVPTGDMRFTVGAGQINLNIPQRVGYELVYDLGVGKITINGRDIADVSSGRDKYTSSGFDSSETKLNIYVSVGVGTFNIESN